MEVASLWVREGEGSRRGAGNHRQNSGTSIRNLQWLSLFL